MQQQWRSIYVTGGVTTFIALVGILLDVIIGNITGGNLSELPQEAVERYAEFKCNPWVGLYNLDLLNTINQIILIPAYVALFSAHRNVNVAPALLAFIIFLVGSIIFITTNTALPMLELSHKYFGSALEDQKNLYAAAGEAMLARGAHGSLGVFIGSVLINVAGIIMSVVMLQGKVFNRTTSYLGIAGSALMVVYFVLVTFVPSAKNMATVIAMPGGLMAMAWMILFAVRLFKLSKTNN